MNNWISDTGVIYDRRKNLGSIRDPMARNCLSFNGTNQYGVYSLRNPIDAYPFTLFGWANPPIDGSHYLFGLSTPTFGTGRLIGFSPQRLINAARIVRDMGTRFGTDVTIANYSNQWSSWVVSFTSATTIDIFRNGELVQSLFGLNSSTLIKDLTRFLVGVYPDNAPTAYFNGRAMHCGYLRRAATLEDAQTFDATGIIPNAEGLFLLDGNSTTIEYNIGTEGEPFARRNLFLWSDDFINAFWTKLNTTSTQNTITENSSSGIHQIDGSATSQITNFTLSAIVSIVSGTRQLYVSPINTSSAGSTAAAIFNLSTGTYVGPASGKTGAIIGTPTITSLGEGRYAISVTTNATVSGLPIRPCFRFLNGTTENYLGDGSSTIRIEQPQLELGSTPTDYQRITTGIYTNEMSIINGASGMLYKGRDVPFDRKNKNGYSPRRNLAVWTDQFENAAWTKNNAPIIQSNVAEAPDGSMTADRLVIANGFSGSIANANSNIRQSRSVINGQVYTFSVLGKADTRDQLQLYLRDNTTAITAIFDLAAGIVLSGTGAITALSNGWYCCSITYAMTSSYSGSDTIRIGSTGDIGDGVTGILIAGAQLELGNTPSDYQSIGTDPGTSVLFPATLYSPGKSAAGDDLQFAGPVPMNAQAEESNTFSFDGVDDYIQFTPADMNAIAGPELVTNGDFSNGTTGWTHNAPIAFSVSSGQAVVSRNNSQTTDFPKQDIGMIPGRSYEVTADIVASSNNVSIYLGIPSTGNEAIFNTAGVNQTRIIVASGSSIYFGPTGTISATCTIDNVSVKELPSSSVEKLGNQLVTNPGGPFTVTTGWSNGAKNPTISVVSGRLRMTATEDGVNRIVSAITGLTIGRRYKVQVSYPTSTLFRFTASSTGAGAAAIIDTSVTEGSWVVAATATTMYVTMVADILTGSFVEMNSVSVKQVADIDSQGTSILTYRSQGDGITGTAGTAYEIKLGDAEEIPCSEGAGVEVYGVIRNTKYNIINGQASIWEAKQNTFHPNLTKGFTFKNNTPSIDPVATLGLSTRIGAVFDFADMSTLFQDRAGTTPVTAPGQLIGQFRDKSPNNLHATAVSDALRGVWAREPKTGRRNLLFWSEDFSNANWIKLNSTVSGVAGNQLLTDDATNGVHNIRQEPTVSPAGQQFTLSATVSANTITSARLVLQTSPSNFAFASFNLSTLQTNSGMSGDFTGTSSAITLQGDGRYRIRLTTTVGADTSWASYGVQIRTEKPYTTHIYTGSGESIIVHNMQLELGPTATAYQRVTTAFDVTEEGVPNVYSIARGGTNMAYTTPSANFSVTNKVTVVAGTSKASDAATAVLVELGTTSAFNSFTLLAPSFAGANSYRIVSGGATAGIGVFAAAPDLSVILAYANIATPSVVLRRNGTDVATSSASQGTGNYQNTPLELFSNGSLYFNGRCYRLALGGDNYDLETYQAIEDWTSDNTPTLPRLHVLGPWRLPASDSNPGYDVEGNPLTNPPVVGLNNAETKINFSPVADTWHESHNIPGADLPNYSFDGDPGDIDIGNKNSIKENKFTIRRE